MDDDFILYKKEKKKFRFDVGNCVPSSVVVVGAGQVRRPIRSSSIYNKSESEIHALTHLPYIIVWWCIIIATLSLSLYTILLL